MGLMTRAAQRQRVISAFMRDVQWRGPVESKNQVSA
jgi:hypothetical protein